MKNFKSFFRVIRGFLYIIVGTALVAVGKEMVLEVKAIAQKEN